MQKTKLGISVGLLGAVLYFMGIFSGYLLVVLLAAYVLVYEENGWLKQSAVRAVAILLVFSFGSTAVKLIPDAIDFIDNIAMIFGGHFHITVMFQLSITCLINICKKQKNESHSHFFVYSEKGL